MPRAFSRIVDLPEIAPVFPLDGAILLGNFYAPGTALDPLRVE